MVQIRKVRQTKGSVKRRHSKDLSFDEGWVSATPVFLAAKPAEAHILRLLIDAGERGALSIPRDDDTDGSRRYRLRRRSTDGLLDPGEVDVALLQNEDERSVMRSGLKAVREALEKDVDVNLTNEGGDIAPHAAATHGSDSVVRVLAAPGTKLEAKNKPGVRPLQRPPRGGQERGRRYFARWGRSDIVLQNSIRMSGNRRMEEVVIDVEMPSAAQSEAFHPSIVADRVWCGGKRRPDRSNNRDHRRARTQRPPEDHWRGSVVGRCLKPSSDTTAILGW
jgi:hypothetical protein